MTHCSRDSRVLNFYKRSSHLSHRESSGGFSKNQRQERALELLLKSLIKQY